jgi:peptidoglycan/xylan/chitin deacetylase (PgdA/CDA1 family)
VSFKHKTKLRVRELYARVLFHTGLHALVNRLMPPRLTILAGHCVGPAEGAGGAAVQDGAHLPADMKIAPEQLERILGWFQRRYELSTVGGGVERIFREQGGAGARRSLVALSMDDGYRDNYSRLLPVLRRLRAPATVFLESRPLDERKVNWSHKYFWILERMSQFDFVHRYGELTKETQLFHEMNQVVTEGRLEPLYHVKRLLKYDASPQDRDLVVDRIFREQGGDERKLCDELYMTWDEAREMRDAGVELGGHTVNHVILSRCPQEEAEREIREGRAAMERELGVGVVTFAYPWGRRWDFNRESREAVGKAGFGCAVTMHPGVNRRQSDPWELKRVAIDGGVRLHLLVAEACGGFELLRKVGVDLSE